MEYTSILWQHKFKEVGQMIIFIWHNKNDAHSTYFSIYVGGSGRGECLKQSRKI